MPNCRFLLAILLLSSTAFAQTDCPELPQGVVLVPDAETVHVDDLGSLIIYPYFNDSLPQVVDNSTINYEYNFVQVPPCFEWEYGDIESALYGSNNDTTDCCGTYEIAYSVWAYGGTFGECLLESTITITVECDQPQDCSLIDLAIAAENQSAECVPVCGGAITTVIAPFNDQLEYTWTIDGGSVINTLSNPANVEVQWDTPGEGIILVEMTGPGGTNVLQQCVDIGNAPTAAFSAPNTSCLGSPVQFTSNATVGSDHFWQFGDGATSGAVSPLHEYGSPGIYTALLTVSSPLYGDDGEIICTCTDSIFQEIEVLNTIGPSIECISTLCEGDSACYWTTDGCAGANYTWTATDAAGNPMAFEGQGTPEICLQWGNGPHGNVSLLITGCGAPCPEPTAVQVPIISSNGAVTGPDVACEGSLAVYSVPKWMDVVYQWNVTGALSSEPDGNSIAVVWGAAGTGNVSVTYQSPFLGSLTEHNFPDCSGSAALSVDIRPALDLTSAPELGCIDVSTVFSASSAAVTWSVAPNQPGTASGVDFAVNFADVGPHLVTATATNPLQFCNTDVTATIVIEEVPNITVLGPIEECAGVDLLYAVDTTPPGFTHAWSATGATPSTSTSTNILLNWDLAAANHSVNVTTAMEDAPFCSATSTLDFTPWIPSTPLGLDHDEACANTLDTLFAALNSPLNEGYIEWTIEPSIAGSVVEGQGTDTVVVQWNDFDGNVTIGLVSEVCELTTEANFNLLVHGTPDLDIVQTGHLCNGAYVPAALSTAPAFVSYVWTLPDYFIENDSTVNAVDTVSTEASIGDLSVFDYSVTVTDIYGCEGTAHYAMEPSPAPAVSINSSANLPICAGPVGDIFICAPANADWSYDWSNGEANSSFFYALTGAPSTLSVTTTNTTTGCQSSTTQTMESDCSGGGGGGGGETCDSASGLTAGLTRSCNTITVTTGCTDCTDITWYFGDGSGGSAGPTHMYDEAGCYEVTAFGNVPSTTPGETCLFGEELHVCIPMAARFDTDRLGCTTIQFQETTTFLDIPGEDNEIIGWSWDFGDGNTSVDPNPLHTFADTGLHTITLTATSLNGCEVEYSTTLNLTFDAITDVTLGLPICLESPSTHVAQTPGAVSYEWAIPDGVGFVGDTVLHTFSSIPTGAAITATGYDMHGCPQSTTVSMLVNPLPPDPLEGIDDVVLCADPGEVLLESDPLFVSHQWFDQGEEIPGATGPDLLAEAGKFYVFATDPEGCSIESRKVRVQVRPDPMPTIVGPAILCDAGEATFEVTGNYIAYEWYVDGSFYSATETLTVSGVPGMQLDIQAVVTDEENCAHTSNLHEFEWASSPEFNLVASDMPPCAASDVVLTVTPADPAVDYYWSNGNTGTAVTTSQAGVYTAIGIDANGCTHSNAFEIHPLPDLCSVPSGCYENCLPDTLCSPAEFSSHQWYLNSAAVSGGLLPCLEVDQSGVYHVIASNGFGCFNQSEPLELTLEACDCDITGALLSDSSCCASLSFENNSGVNLQILEVTTSGDTATFAAGSEYTVLASGADFIQLEFNGDNNLPQGDLGAVVQLCFDAPGTHQVDWTWTGSGASVCEGALIWDEPIIGHTTTPEICPDQCDGTVTTNITSGAGWTVTFANADGTAADPTALCQGTYVHTMTDGGGCILNDTLNVDGPAPFEANFTANDAPCNETAGNICIQEVLGGTGMLTTTVIPEPISGNDSCFQVESGNYQLVLQDALGCLSTPWNVDISEPLPIQTFTAITPVTCHGDGDGMVAVNATGGTGDLSLASPFVLPALPDTLPFTGGGTVELIVIDDNGCTDTTLAEVPEPDPVSLTLLALTGIDCNGECTGVADFTATGGTGTLSYHLNSISDSTGATLLDFQSLCAGEQTVFVSDENGCVDSVSMNVPTSEPLEFTIVTENITCTGMNDGSFQISLSGGSGNVGWVILGDAWVQDSLAEGDYFLSGFDDLGCEVDSSFEIGADIVTDMELTTFSTPVSCWEAEDGTATVAVTGGNTPISYLWNDPDGQAAATAIGLNADTYDVVVTDNIGCTLSQTVEVESNEDCLFIAEGITPNGDGINDVWVVGGLEFFPLSKVTVVNRWGQVMFESAPGTTAWTGKFNGQPVPAGDYYFVIRPEPGKRPITGTVTVKY